jgi:hypothetical protein
MFIKINASNEQFIYFMVLLNDFKEIELCSCKTPYGNFGMVKHNNKDKLISILLSLKVSEDIDITIR